MNQQISDVIVVGGGASGMIAAIMAARNGSSVTILEHMNQTGKKILATGNGKCNYTNTMQGMEYYYGENPAFVLPVFKQFGQEETVLFFKELGIYPKIKNGYCYPASEQAASILQVLTMEMKRLQVLIVLNCGIREIHKEKNQFVFDTKTNLYYSKTCIIATGGKASKVTGSDGSGFLYLERLGHHIIDVVPALVQLQGKQPFFKELAGIRAEISLKLYIDKVLSTADSGELQLTDFGISGIPVFQVSRFASRALVHRKEVYVIIDFMPGLSNSELYHELQTRFLDSPSMKTAFEALIGMFNQKLISVLLYLAHIKEHQKALCCTNIQLQDLTTQIKEFRVDVTGTKNFDFAQATAGGIDTTEINNQTLESKLISGMFFAGEVIDIDGKCGGYNLQWAWSSGYVAGICAAHQIKNRGKR